MGLGFTLVGGGPQLDLDKASFDKAVQSFGNALVGAEVALFYYAGHGVQVRGANYLVPVGADPVKEADVDFQMLDAALVLRQMESGGSRLNLVILDACRNNPFGGRGLRATAGGLAQMQAPQGTLVSFATQPGNVALDGVDGHSPYSRALARVMRRPGLDIFRTFNEVGLDVASATGGSQQPWTSNSPIKGDFYFAGAPKAAAPALPRASAPDPAGLAWSVTQNTTSVAVLEAFADRFKQTVYGDLARARLAELKKAQRVATLPPQTIPKAGGIAPAATPQPPAASAPDDSYCARAKAHWESMQAIGTIEAYENHLVYFRGCQYAAAAKAKIAELKRLAAIPKGARKNRPARNLPCLCPRCRPFLRRRRKPSRCGSCAQSRLRPLFPRQSICRTASGTRRSAAIGACNCGTPPPARCCERRPSSGMRVIWRFRRMGDGLRSSTAPCGSTMRIPCN